MTGACLPTLVALADHSLLHLDPDSGRFAIHELIRQFAGERLEAAGEAEVVRDAHSAYYLAALPGRLPDLRGRDQAGAVDDIEGDFENVRVGWLWAVAERQWSRFPEASQSLFLFTAFHGRQLDGIELFDVVYGATRSATTERERLAYAYAVASGQALACVVVLEEDPGFQVADLRALTETVDNADARAYCQLMLGTVLFNLAWLILRRDADLATNRALLDEGLGLTGEHLTVRRVQTQGLRAEHCLLECNYEEVLVLTEELLALAARNVTPWVSRAKPRANVQRGTAFLALGNLGAARRFMGRGLAEMVEQNMEVQIAIHLPFVGLLLAQWGEHERAVELIAHGLTRSHARGRLEADPLIRRARATLEELLGQERFAAAWERARQLEPMAVARQLLPELQVVDGA